ncbi:hypothetical protein [Paenibacillus crassostreae]|uniref:Phosphatidylinositol kinase n=1 Tax=Paenibacillus crassostreae TaxID=1763538 RepID=A0A162RKJ1_9BACL|nr:hypothetical protein [Paenibacillus crassostreae]AOZ91730.1 hypothetical protein LPB68_05530 [Paenibacillus crassostreae]OAB72697.1 hypothetical protein PNBC_14720 [Paenibacillus crassostreae]
MEKFEAKQLCQQHIHRYVRVMIQDGRAVDGFIENVDDENIYLAVPVGHEMNNEQVEAAQYHGNNAPVGSYENPSMLQPAGYENPSMIQPTSYENPSMLQSAGYGPQQGYGNQSGCGCGGQSWGTGTGGYPGVDTRGFFPGYGYYPAPAPFYGYPYGRRRFNRVILPLTLFTTLALLPYF